MEPLKIKEYPDKILRRECLPVERVADTERKLFEEMLFAMRYYAGIGLAAPQIGIARRLIVADIGGDAIQLANPVILKTSGSDLLREGCLSIPGVNVTIRRADEIVVSGLNENGETVAIEAEGLLARVLQHEIDHLNGKLIIDYADLLARVQFFASRFKGARQKQKGENELMTGVDLA